MHIDRMNQRQSIVVARHAQQIVHGAGGRAGQLAQDENDQRRIGHRKAATEQTQDRLAARSDEQGGGESTPAGNRATG